MFGSLMDLYQEVLSKKSEIQTEEIEKYAELICKEESALLNRLSSSLFSDSDVGRRAFEELSKETVRTAIHTYCVKKQHWKDENRSLRAYCFKCLKHLRDNIKHQNAEKLTFNKCPACNHYGDKTALVKTDNGLFCQTCSSKLENNECHTKEERNFRSVFLNHNSTGYRCPCCLRFVPKSISRVTTFCCPYPDCSWYGTRHDMAEMAHPSMRLMVKYTQLSEDSDTFRSYNSGKCAADQHAQIEVKVDFDSDYKLVKSVLQAQLRRAERRPLDRTIKKRTMFEAYLQLLDEDPTDLVRYLVHRQARGESPLHSRIFQRYIYLLENKLPFEIKADGLSTTVYSILDNSLNIFSGVAEYETVIRDDYSLKNETKQRYYGAKNNKDYGPHFIGLLEDVIDENGVSLMDHVTTYSFSSIQLNTGTPGTKVKVKHLSIPSHYETGGLVQLQRIRRTVVDSVYKRKHGEARPIKSFKKTPDSQDSIFGC